LLNSILDEESSGDDDESEVNFPDWDHLDDDEAQKSQYATPMNGQSVIGLEDEHAGGELLPPTLKIFDANNGSRTDLEDSAYSTPTGEKFSADLQNELADLESPPPGMRRLYSIRKAQFVYPLSQYEGYIPPLPISKEMEVVKEFSEMIAKAHPSGTNGSFEGDDFVEFELSDFFIYLPGSGVHYPFEMAGLQNLLTRRGHSLYYFDGILSVAGQKRYVQRIPFRLCSIGNYGEEYNTVENIWIQTEFNKNKNIYYRLKTPADQYERFHEGFLWLANLSKHFVDYSHTVTESNEKVSIQNFKSGFAEWAYREHSKSPEFLKWFKEHNHPDFRRAIVANIEFLSKEAIGTFSSLENLVLWKEMRSRTAVPSHPIVEKMTVVTPYVYECFSHLRFRNMLKRVRPINFVEAERKRCAASQSLSMCSGFVGSSAKHAENSQLDKYPSDYYQHETAKLWKSKLKGILSRPFDKGLIAVGDILGVTKDEDGHWKDEHSRWKSPDDCWYVYIQGIRVKNGVRSFDVIWLYKAADTTCALMKYPYHNELFLSDNCSCSTSTISEDEVLCKVSVAWNGSPGSSDADFFIRQTYLHDNSFITLQEHHKKCDHYNDNLKTPLQALVDTYSIGDTVLVQPPSEFKSLYGLEPAVIVQFTQEGAKGLVRLRRLRRRREIPVCGTSKPNELVWTPEIFTSLAEKVVRKCLVRFYTREQADERRIPPPYNRNGTGDAFYISSILGQVDGEYQLHDIDLADLPQPMVQGLDPELPPLRPQLRGLDLYCGGGNFARGIEEGGAVHFGYAVDLNTNAIHTYRANLKDPESTKLFLGSVDDVLMEAMMGNPQGIEAIPPAGSIDFIGAGSPCQGYSLLNWRKDEDKGLKNQSLVASVAAYVDFYRPKYALLENVMNMAQSGKYRDNDVLSQLICCLVGMGYQIQLFTLDSWSFGSPQTRSRLFVSIATPGVELPSHPQLSHSHPPNTTDRGLGRMANGKSFGQRKFGHTPFNFVSAEEATEDLPDIGDARTHHCTPYPDHRIATGIPERLKMQIEAIPITPRGMNFAKTWASGRMSVAERELYPTTNKKGTMRACVTPVSNAWGRVIPQMLFPTIATSIQAECARSGRCLHWDQQRLITIQEARRAQSFPDEEVLTGSPVEQFRIVGNSVARTVSLGLGLSLRVAWLKNSPDTDNRNDINLPITLYLTTDLEPLNDTPMGQKTPDSISYLETNSIINPNKAEAYESDSSDGGGGSDEQYQRTLRKFNIESSVSGDDISSSSSKASAVPKVLSSKRHLSLRTISTNEQSSKKTKVLFHHVSIHDHSTRSHVSLSRKLEVSSLAISQIAYNSPPPRSQSQPMGCIPKTSNGA
jgi:DNA (cytosine-5)-methyltransferase 1